MLQIDIVCVIALRKAEGLGDSLLSPQGCMAHHINAMVGEQQTE